MIQNLWTKGVADYTFCVIERWHNMIGFHEQNGSRKWAAVETSRLYCMQKDRRMSERVDDKRLEDQRPLALEDNRVTEDDTKDQRPPALEDNRVAEDRTKNDGLPLGAQR